MLSKWVTPLLLAELEVELVVLVAHGSQSLVVFFKPVDAGVVVSTLQVRDE